MTRNKLIALWLGAILLFALAVIYLPHSWEHTGEGSYLVVNLTIVWVLATLLPVGVLTVWWLRRPK